MSDGGQPAKGGGIRARFDAARVELLRTLWGPSELPASALGRLRAQQIAAVTKATPLMMCGNIMCALAVVAVFWDTAQMDVLLWWAAIFSGLSGLAIWQWVTRRGLPERATASARAVKRLAWRAVIPALCLSFPTLFLFPSIDDQQRLLISSIVTGSLCVGLFGLSSVPLAALSYASVMVAGAATAMAMTGDPSFIPIGLLLFVYAACALGSVAWYSRLFVDRFTRSLEIEHQSELIGMLLHDFEKQASDWLWEMDAEGRFQLGVQRFAEALGVPSGDLDGRKISDLLAVDQASRGERDAFLGALAGREPFGGLVAPLARGHQTRWLSLTAKPVHDAAGAFIGWRGVASDVTDAKLSERDMRHMAHHDALTGLPNRTALAARLDQAVQVLHERGQPFAVLLIDLDDFKAVNDTLGHGAGDQLLVEMSGKLAAAKPEDALLARLGGDEFALIAPSHGEPDAAEALCARLLATLGSDFDLGGARVMVGGSIGLVIAPQDGIDPETLMRRADLALYRAKADGRRCARRFDDGIEIAARRRRHIEDRLRGAIERGDLALHYQPIVSLKGETVVAAEALMRWRDAELGPISRANSSRSRRTPASSCRWASGRSRPPRGTRLAGRCRSPSRSTSRPRSSRTRRCARPWRRRWPIAGSNPGGSSSRSRRPR